MATSKTVIVTTGGTAEPIDDVRQVTNFSTGKFGHEVAKAFADLGYQVDSLTAKASMWMDSHPGVTKRPFTSAGSLRRSLLGSDNPAIIMMAAAVSDYTPTPTAGKISSSQDKLVITMHRTPKILAELRGKFGKETFIVGFKLLSNVSREELILAAQKQLKDNHLNLVVANDLSQLKDGMHPLIVITPEGGAIDFSGTRQEVARQLAEFVMHRTEGEWFHSVANGIDSAPKDESLDTYGEVLRAAQSMNLFPDTTGYISVKRPDGTLWISPRQVDKGAMTADDAVLAEVDLSERVILFAGEQKPSSDTGVNAILYQSTRADVLLHFHYAWGKMSFKTKFPRPCGSTEEAKEILRSVSRFDIAPDGFSVDLVHHGFLICLNSEHRHWAHMEEEFANTKRAFLHHAEEVLAKSKISVEFDPKKLKPIFGGIAVVGIVYDDPEAATLYIAEGYRSRGIGRIVTEQLKDRGYTIRTLEDCGVADYYQKAGFSIHRGKDGLMRLVPPRR